MTPVRPVCFAAQHGHFQPSAPASDTEVKPEKDDKHVLGFIEQLPDLLTDPRSLRDGYAFALRAATGRAFTTKQRRYFSLNVIASISQGLLRFDRNSLMSAINSDVCGFSVKIVCS